MYTEIIEIVQVGTLLVPGNLADTWYSFTQAQLKLAKSTVSLFKLLSSNCMRTVYKHIRTVFSILDSQRRTLNEELPVELVL